MKLILATVAIAIALQGTPFSAVCMADEQEEAKRVELTGTFTKHKTLEVQFVDEDGTKYNIITKLKKKAAKYIDKKVEIVAKVKPGKKDGNKLVVYLGKIKEVSDADEQEEAKRVELTGTFTKHKTLEVQFVDEDGTKYNITPELKEKAAKYIDEKVEIVAKVKPAKKDGNKLIVYLGKIKKVSDSQ